MMTLLSDDPIEQSLLRGVYEDWGERASVLIYADWLDEQSTEETTLRARLLRQTWAPDQPAADRETQASTPVDAGRAWLTARRICHRRGVRLDATGVVPVLVFPTVDAWLESVGRPEFGEDPLAVRFAAPDAGGAGLDADDAARLADSPPAARLRVLNLGFNRLGATGAAHLAESRRFEKLLRLDLTQNRLGDLGAIALAEGSGLTSLRSLALADNEIGPRGAQALSYTTRLPKLETLDLRGNPLRDAGRYACRRLRERGVDAIDHA